MKRHTIFANSAVAFTLYLIGVAAHADAYNWIRQFRNDPLTHKTLCVLVSATQTLYDGYQDTSVYLELDKARLQVISESNFDVGGKPLGLSVDGGPFIAFNKLVMERRLLFTRDIDQIIDQFIKGNSAQLQLRFWPTWPATGDKSINFSLLGFTRAYRSQCD